MPADTHPDEDEGDTRPAFPDLLSLPGGGAGGEAGGDQDWCLPVSSVQRRTSWQLC